jgi:hypothetical protein
MNKLKIALGALLVLLVGCQEPEAGGSPFEILPEIPLKKLSSNANPVGAICYVDVDKYNPLNAKDYVFTARGSTPETQFFDYVVLGYSYLTKTRNGYIQLETTPALKYILDNSITYIKPLHQKGVRVLIEVRSGNFADDQDGIGAGLGTLDMAAINELVKEFKLIVNQYGIDGFDFNDMGGGKTAYPPLTRYLTQFQSDTPLYPETLFKEGGKEDGAPLTDAAIEALLWIEGGSNFSNLVQRTNEALKVTYTSTYKNGSNETTDVQTVERIILVRNKNHGDHLLSQLRMAYMPDAYTGADPKTIGNLRYLINDAPCDIDKPKLHAPLWDEAKKLDVGAEEADDKYAPFAVDLADQLDRDTVIKWTNVFLWGSPEGRGSNPPSTYGALYFTNLSPVSESNSVTYMTYFSQALFNRNVTLSGSGDYKKTW